MRILVVDDDPVGLMVASTVVESLGHAVSMARDGETAWQLLLEEQFDVVISDREMPGLDGLQLCRRLRALVRPDAGERTYTYLILLTGHDAFAQALEGMEAGADDYLAKPLDPGQLQLRLTSARRVTDLHAQLERKQRELEAVNDAEHALARRDALTLLLNRRALQEELHRLDARSDRNGYRYHVALIDLDHFKSFNDTAGHGAGDEALTAVAQTLSGEVRQTDGLYRYGGEEFVLLIDSASEQGARSAVERMRMAVQDLALAHPGRPGECMTISVGYAGSAPGRTTGSSLLEAADAALYRAKHAGRNRTERASDTCDEGVPAGAAAGPSATDRAEEQGQPADARAPVLLDPGPLRDMHELGQRLGRGVAEEVVQAYLRQSDEWLAALQLAVDTRSDEGVARAAHSLKGSSATVGALAVSRTCNELEQAHLQQRRAQLVEQLQRLAAATNVALERQLSALLVG